MRTTIRKAGVACGALFASSALAVTTATGAWGSNSALVVAGLETSSLHDSVMSQLLGGGLQGQQRVSVNWPAEAAPFTGASDLSLGDSIAVGITNLNTQLDLALDRLAGPSEKVTVVGLSAGSLVVNEVLRQLAADANAPDKDQITFVVVADSSRQKVIDKAKYNSQYDYTYQPAPETKYDVVVVVSEFDGTHDFPDRWWNFTALLNSIAGTIVGHISVMFADLSDVPATNIEVDVNNKGGTTTTYYVKNDVLPLVQLLPFLKSQEASLTATVKKGYSRYDNAPSSVQASAVAAPAVVDEAEDSATPATEAKIAEPAEQATEVEPVNDVVPADATDDAVDEEAADVDSDVDSETASVEDAADAEAEGEAEAVETEAAETEADASDDEDSSVSESSDDAPSSDAAPSSDSGSADSSDSE